MKTGLGEPFRVPRELGERWLVPNIRILVKSAQIDMAPRMWIRILMVFDSD